MDGVTVLNEIEIVKVVNDTFNYTAAFTALFITVLICGIVGFFIGRAECEEFGGAAIGVIVGLILSIFTGGITGIICEYPALAETHIHYEVTIDDSVSMTEFAERYNIIEQRGSIFVIEEKNTDG